MKRVLQVVAVVLASSGCVTQPLKHYTINQSLSVADMRYQEVMNALATVAANPGTLPSYSITANGVANVTGAVSAESMTDWTRAAHNFGQQVFNVGGRHSPDLSWTLDPVAEPYLLAGAWYACRWAIFGPPADRDEYQREYDLLRKPVPMDIVGCHTDDPAGTRQKYHLGVLVQNNSIPSGWLGVGPRSCVPHGACYTAHCGHTYVWAMPDQMSNLSEFTLVLLDIATIDTTWLAQQKLQATVGVELTLPGSTDGKSTITETWSACQMEQPDGSTRIVVLPFAEPFTRVTNAPQLFSVSHLIEKSTLDLYGRNAVKASPELKGRIDTLPAQSDTPQASPPPAANPSVHTP